ncbi:MAG TPA: tetratricopeptide repeat protein [Bryobacteraceae bacterium]|nr:tetratricopeptide repeat protein [Bryobacteraceae bacterium]
MLWVAALLLLWAPQSSDVSTGLKALDEKRYDAAIDSFTKAVAADPKDYAAHFNLGLAYSLTGKNSEAAAQYRETLALKPDLYEAQLNLAIVLLKEKQPAEAIPLLEKAVASKPKQYRPNFYYGEALLEAGEAQKAEAAFQTALSLDAKSAAAELGLGEALLKEHRLAEADPHFRKAAELDPSYRDGLLQLAQGYEDAHQPEQAIPLYQQFPNDPGAQEHLGQLLLASGNAGEAVQKLQAAVAESPTTANRVALAEAYLKAKQPEKALPLIDEALRAEPNEFALVMAHGRILRDQRKFDAAAKDFVRAAQLQPQNWEPWSELAGVLVMLNNYPGAISALDRIRALHAEKPGHIFLRAIVFDHAHDLKPALESYQQFLAMSHGEFPDQEFQARQRARIIQDELKRR